MTSFEAAIWLLFLFIVDCIVVVGVVMKFVLDWLSKKE